MTEMPAIVRAHERAGRYVEVEGARVFVREEGDGPCVLLLHGVPSSSFLYREVIGELASRGCRAVAFDFPGLGLSDKPPGRAYDWHALAESLGHVVEALDLPPVHLVVHDIGGPIGAEWAIRNPARVASLTITNTLLDVARFSPPFPMNLFRVPGLKHLVFETQSPALFAPIFRRRGVKHFEKLGREGVEAYLYLLRRDHGRHAFLEIMAGFDLSEEHGDFLRGGLLDLGLPMQLVWGEHEVAIPLEQLRYIQRTFPLRHEHFVDGRHFLSEDQPEELAAHVAAFVREVTATP